MSEIMKKLIYSIELKILYLVEQLGTTIEYCLAQYDIRKKNANTEAILGVAWHCLKRAKEANKGELIRPPQWKNISSDDESAMFYINKASEAFGMAKVEFGRTQTMLVNLQKARKEATKYTQKDWAEWDKLTIEIDPKGDKSNAAVAKIIRMRLGLPETADQIIRRKILSKKIRKSQA